MFAEKAFATSDVKFTPGLGKHRPCSVLKHQFQKTLFF